MEHRYAAVLKYHIRDITTAFPIKISSRLTLRLTIPTFLRLQSFLSIFAPSDDAIRDVFK